MSVSDQRYPVEEAPILGYPDPDGHFILDTDASAYDIGDVLQNGEGRMVASVVP